MKVPETRKCKVGFSLWNFFSPLIISLLATDFRVFTIQGFLDQPCCWQWSSIVLKKDEQSIKNAENEAKLTSAIAHNMNIIITTESCLIFCVLISLNLVGWIQDWVRNGERTTQQHLKSRRKTQLKSIQRCGRIRINFNSFYLLISPLLCFHNNIRIELNSFTSLSLTHSCFFVFTLAKNPALIAEILNGLG